MEKHLDSKGRHGYGFNIVNATSAQGISTGCRDLILQGISTRCRDRIQHGTLTRCRDRIQRGTPTRIPAYSEPAGNQPVQSRPCPDPKER